MANNYTHGGRGGDMACDGPSQIALPFSHSRDIDDCPDGEAHMQQQAPQQQSYTQSQRPGPQLVPRQGGVVASSGRAAPAAAAAAAAVPVGARMGGGLAFDGASGANTQGAMPYSEEQQKFIRSTITRTYTARVKSSAKEAGAAGDKLVWKPTTKQLEEMLQDRFKYQLQEGNTPLKPRDKPAGNVRQVVFFQVRCANGQTTFPFDLMVDVPGVPALQYDGVCKAAAHKILRESSDTSGHWKVLKPADYNAFSKFYVDYPGMDKEGMKGLVVPHFNGMVDLHLSSPVAKYIMDNEPDKSRMEKVGDCLRLAKLDYERYATQLELAIDTHLPTYDMTKFEVVFTRAHGELFTDAFDVGLRAPLDSRLLIDQKNQQCSASLDLEISYFFGSA